MTILNENLVELAIPGIYEIQCISNNKVYIGESECMLARFGKHVATLTQSKHDCKELQKDWNKFGIEKFTMNVKHCFTRCFA
jgi:ribosome biogenesis protein Nip4